MSIRIDIIPALTDNFVYVLSDSQGECVIIDPSEYAPIAAFLQMHSLRPSHVLCTHHHWDHIGGLPELINHFKPEVWCSAYDRSRIPGSTRGLKESERLKILGQDLKIIEVPGHTLGQICYWLPKLKSVFVGDTLFSGGCGRLFEGSYEQLFTSLGKIKALPSSTQLYFGHEYTLRNLQFVVERGNTSPELEAYKNECEAKLSQGLPTTPSDLARELRINPFLMATDLPTLKDWREARNVWRN